MTPHQIAHAFDKLARGAAMETVQEEMTALGGMLPDGDKLGLMQLALALTKLQNPRALEAFDSAMDVLTCCAYTPSADHPSRWTTLLVSTVFQRPEGASLVHFDNAGEAEARIAAALGLPLADVRVFPVLWATDRLYYYDAADVFCLSNSCAHQLAEGTMSADEIETLQDAARSNSLASTREPSVEDEALLYVCLRAAPTLKESLVNRLREAQITFGAIHPVDGHEPLIVEHRLLDAGSPWRMARSSLHISRVLSLARLVTDVAERTGRGLEDLCVYFSQVEAAGDGGISVRTAVHTREDTLLAGIIEGELAEPDQYVSLAKEALEAAGVTVCQAADVYPDSVVGDSGSLGVLLPGKGWQRADFTFVPAAEL